MTKKTRLIPFDYQKYLDGAKAISRDLNLHVISILPAGENIYKYLVIYRNNNNFHVSETITKNGHTHGDTESHNDVLLEEISEEKTFYVNIYPEWVGRATYDSIEEAQKGKSNSDVCRGILKVTYTDEDLIK